MFRDVRQKSVEFGRKPIDRPVLSLALVAASRSVCILSLKRTVYRGGILFDTIHHSRRTLFQPPLPKVSRETPPLATLFIICRM